MARQLSDSLILPFNVSDYGNVITDLATTVLDRFEQMMKEKDIETGMINVAVTSAF